MPTSQDVVIVGGGIAGASLAYALASAGVRVTVLEASGQYRDRVRGESMVPWGVKEARELGVEQIFLDAGAHVSPLWKRYTAEDEPFDIPVSVLAPGVAGTINLRHPDACQALIDAAGSAGAAVVRSVSDVRLDLADPVRVSYRTDTGPDQQVRTGLVVGADGRASVVRQQAGIELERQESVNYITGLLVDGLDQIPDDHDVLSFQDDLMFLLFHQKGGRARLYLAGGLSGQHRFAGRHAAEAFLAACDPPRYNWAVDVRVAVPAGPCATYPGDDTWTATPYRDGIVLVGDAAGHNDPIIGQGLSIAMRDARTVRDLILSGARNAADFASYGDERDGRMRRLRLAADINSVQVEDADNRPARRARVNQMFGDPGSGLVQVMLGAFMGPETIPEELVRSELLERIRSA